MAAPGAIGTANRGVFNGEVGCIGCDDPLPPDGSMVLDMSHFASEILPALIVSKPLLDSFNKKPTVPFVHYAGFGDAAAAAANAQRDVKSKQEFWVIHMVGAYEAWAQDNDPDSPFLSFQWTVGYATNPGSDDPTFVYTEEWRDLAADGTNINLVNYATGIQLTAAHEAMHRFVGRHDPAIDIGLMDGVGALSGGARLIGVHFQRAQGIKYPR